MMNIALYDGREFPDRILPDAPHSSDHNFDTDIRLEEVFAYDVFSKCDLDFPRGLLSILDARHHERRLDGAPVHVSLYNIDLTMSRR